jgi:antitoxin (DNA-binding transcriptional repressor) of toxin-antitoxin stability system
MRASFVDLRKKSAQIIRALNRRESVTVLYRGRPKAIMHPLAGEGGRAGARAKDHLAFGLWADRRELRNVASHVRRLRRGRRHDR